MIDDKMNVDLKSVVGGDLGLFGQSTETSANGIQGSGVANQPLFSQALKNSEDPKPTTPQALPPVVAVPVGPSQALELAAKEDRRMLMNDLLKELEADLKISPEQLVDAFGKLDKSLLLKPPEATVGDLAQALGLSGDQKEDFVELYQEFLNEMDEAKKHWDEKRTKGVIWSAKEGLPRVKLAPTGHGSGALVGDPGEMVQWMKMNSAKDPLALSPSSQAAGPARLGAGELLSGPEGQETVSFDNSAQIPWALPGAAGYAFTGQPGMAAPAKAVPGNQAPLARGANGDPGMPANLAAASNPTLGKNSNSDLMMAGNLGPILGQQSASPKLAAEFGEIASSPLSESDGIFSPTDKSFQNRINPNWQEQSQFRRDFGYFQQNANGQGGELNFSQEGVSFNGSPLRGQEVLEFRPLSPQAGDPSIPIQIVTPLGPTSPQQEAIFPAMSLTPTGKSSSATKLGILEKSEDKSGEKTVELDLAADSAAPLMTLDQKGARIADAITQAFTGATTSLEPTTNVGQVVQQAQFLANQGGGELKMILNPPGLGAVNLSVALEKGQVKVELVTETPEAKKILESSMGDLRTGLRAHNLQVDSIRVDLAANLSREFDLPKENSNGAQNQNQARDFLGRFRDQNQSQRQAFMGPEEFQGGSEFRRTHEGPQRASRPGGRVHYIA